MTLFALQMLLDPTGTRVPSIKKGKLGNQAQGHALSAANMNIMSNNVGMNMRMGMPGFGMGMGIGLPGMPPMTMPMYGVPTVSGVSPMTPGVHGMSMVAVNGGMGHITPSSPCLTPVNNATKATNNSNGHINGRDGDGGGKARRPSSVYDLSAEFGRMQVSMARAQSSGPTTTIPPSGHNALGQGSAQYAKTGTKRSSLDVDSRRRHSSYGTLLR